MIDCERGSFLPKWTSWIHCSYKKAIVSCEIWRVFIHGGPVLDIWVTFLLATTSTFE